MQALLLQFWELKIKCNFHDERLMNSLRQKWRHLQLKVSGNFSFHFSLSTLTSYITRRDADQIFTLNFYFQISKEKNSSCDGHETIEDAVFMNEFSIRRFMTSRKQSRFTFKIKSIFFSLLLVSVKTLQLCSPKLKGGIPLPLEKIRWVIIKNIFTWSLSNLKSLSVDNQFDFLKMTFYLTNNGNGNLCCDQPW